VTLREKGSPDVLGVRAVRVRAGVPPQQTRGITATVYFEDLPKLTDYVWSYEVTEIRAIKGSDGFEMNEAGGHFDPEEFIGKTPPPPPPKP
jgi:hypothetical protein